MQLLGSAYLLGAESEHLNDIYEAESKELEPWHDSPGEVSTYDWRDYLGNPKYVGTFIFTSVIPDTSLGINELTWISSKIS